MIHLKRVSKEEWVIVHSHKNGSSEELVIDKQELKELRNEIKKEVGLR